MRRSKNASQRRTVLRAVRDAKSQLHRLANRWDVTGKIYVEPEDRAPGDNLWLRERAVDEYPENRAEDWATLYNQLDQVIRDLSELRETARQSYYRIKEGDQR